MTPFVDVMLVLLVIFMVTAPLLTAGVDVDLPKTQAAQATGQDEPLVVSVNAQKKIYLQETEMERDALIARLKAITANKPEQRIFVRGDRMLPYGRSDGGDGCLERRRLQQGGAGRGDSRQQHRPPAGAGRRAEPCASTRRYRRCSTSRSS